MVSIRRMAAAALCLVMVTAMIPGAAFAESGDKTGSAEQQDIVLEEGTYAPGEVIVVFREGAVKDKKISIRAAQDLENVGDGFGSTMKTTGEEDEAAKDAKSEVSILKKSLGDELRRQWGLGRCIGRDTRQIWGQNQW